MSEELRNTGLEVVGDVPWGSHFCQFYQTPGDLLDILVPYFAAGLRANEFCMWVTSEPLGVEAARSALAAAVPDLEDRILKGQIEILPHTDWYLKGGTFDSARVLADWVTKLENARAAGFEGLRLTGNTFWLERGDWRAFTDYEAAVDGVLGRYRMLAVCTYSLDRCGFEEILDVIRNHEFALVRRGGRWEMIEGASNRRAREGLRLMAQFPEQNPNPVLRVSESGHLIYSNPPAQALLSSLNWKPGDSLPASLRDLAAKALRVRCVVEAEVPDGRGGVHWFSALHPEGASYANLYARDVTERVRAEQDLRRSRESFRVTLSSIGDAVIATDVHGNVTFLNPVAAALTGWHPEDASGRPLRDVFRIINELTRQPAEDIFARVISERKAVALANNTALLSRDGREIPIEDSAAPILDDGGETTGVVLVFHDVTARRQAQKALRESEEKYRLLFQNMAEGFALYELVMDPAGKPVDWRILEVNDAYTFHTGIPLDRVVGRRVGELFPDAVPEYLPVFSRVVATGTPEAFETFAKAVGRHQRVNAFPAGGRRFACTFEDISTRKRGEEALARSEEQYRNLFSNMSEGFALHEIQVDDKGKPFDYRFLDANPAFERLTGIRSREIIGKRVTEVLPGIEPFWIDTYGRVALTGEPASFERHFPAPLDRWFKILAYRPAPMQFAVIFMDITGRREAEEALRRSEEDLRRSREDLDRAQAVGQIGSWRLDVRSNVLTWSDENYRIFGISPGTPLTYETFLNSIHPDDRAYVDARWEAGLRGEPYDIEHRILVDGRVKWIREKAFLEIDDTGKLKGGFGISQDITERRNTEALRHALAEQEKIRLGAAVEQASDSVVMVDPDGTIRYVNAAFEAINQLTRDKATGSSYLDLLAGDPEAESLHKAIVDGGDWHGHMLRRVRDGRPVELEVTICPAADPSGTIIGGLITEKDVTRENALQRQLRQSQKMEALGTLAGGIAHDFNNVLGAIIVNTELALMDLEASHPARSPLPLILQAANRGKDLVKQIITFSRQRTWDRKPLEIAPVVREAAKFMRSTLPKDVAVHVTIAPDCGSIMGDPSQIHQIVVNLCQNAALAMGEKGGTLEVKLDQAHIDSAMIERHPDLKAGVYTRLTVADNGCGIAKADLERIFEPFFTTRGPGGGTGLGLAVVHSIVKGYNGAISVYSEPGKGSVFSLYIPKLENENAPAKPSKAARPVKGRGNILLVEDEAAQRESLAISLGRLGYKVTARAGGRSALSSLRRAPAAFDVVITDQTMPRMSGLELAAEIVKIRPDLPIILCTGFSEKINSGTVGRNGIREFLMKPFSLQELSNLISKVLKPAT